MLIHAFYGKGGPRPPFIFQRGAFLRKGGAKFFRPPIATKTDFTSYRHFPYAS